MNNYIVQRKYCKTGFLQKDIIIFTVYNSYIITNNYNQSI